MNKQNGVSFDKIRQSWYTYLEQKKTIRDLVLVFWTGFWILGWVTYVLPLMKMTGLEQKMALIVIGFVFSSLLLVIGELPIYSSRLTMWFINTIKRQKVNKV